MIKEDLKKKFGVGTSGSSDKKPPATEKETSRHLSFGVDVHSGYIPSIKFEKRNGHIVYMPYSHQPLIDFIPGDGIYLKTLQYVIHITGRKLEELVDALGTQRVKWVKENTTGIDDGSDEIFVMDIEFMEAG